MVTKHKMKAEGIYEKTKQKPPMPKTKTYLIN